MAWEKCPKCKKQFVEYDGYYKTKKCHNPDCGAHIFKDGAYSYVRHDFDKIRYVLRHPDGTEAVMFEYSE